LSASYTGIGVYSKNFTNAFSGSINQASLAQIKEAGAGVYGERRFLLKELSHYAAVISLPSKLGGFGIALHYFGGEQFNSSQIGLGYGKKLSDKIDIGLQFNYNSIHVAGYGNSSTINFEAGTLLHVTDKMHIGIHVYNPVGGRFGKGGNEKLASIYTMGIGYEASDKFFISTAISKEEDQPANMLAAMEYNFEKRFFARLGIATATGNYFFGLGVQWKTFRLDAVSGWQAPLGFTPALQMLFRLHEPNQKQEE